MTTLLTLLVPLWFVPWAAPSLRSCAAPEPIAVEYKGSAAVFTGRVTSLQVVKSVRGTDVHTVATFAVERWWKGGRRRTVKVRTCGGGEAICTVGFAFVTGRRYVVFAAGRPLETTICQRTARIEDAAEVLRWLQSPSRTPTTR